MRYAGLNLRAGSLLLPVLLALPSLVSCIAGAPPGVVLLRSVSGLAAGIWLEWGARSWRDRRLRIGAAVAAALCTAVPVLLEAAGFLLTGNGLDVRFFYHLNMSTLRFGTGGYGRLLILTVGLTAGLIAAAAYRSSFRREDGRAARLCWALLPVWLIFSPLAGAAHLWMPASGADADPAAFGIKPPAADRYHLQAEPGRNLIVVYLESMEDSYLDERQFPGLLPNIRHYLEHEAVAFTGIRCARNADFTLGGIYSSLSGSIFLNRHLLGLRSAVSGGNNGYDVTLGSRLATLPEILHRAGYRQSLLVGVDPHFAGMNVMAHQMRIDEIFSGRRLLTLADAPANDCTVSQWGVRDRYLFRAGLRLAAERLREGKPFALYLVTVDAHHPDGFPEPGGPVYAGRGGPHRPLLDAIHADDRLIRDFVDEFRRLPGAENTVIAFMTDHIAMRNSVSDILERNPDRGLIAFALNAGPARRIATPGRTFDMAPTWAAMIGVRHNSDFLLGEDLQGRVSPERLRGDLPEAEAVLARVLKRFSEPPCPIPPPVRVSAAPYPALAIGPAVVPIFREWGVQQFPTDREAFAVRLTRNGELSDFLYAVSPEMLRRWVDGAPPETEWVILAGVNACDALLPDVQLETDGFYLLRGGPGRWEYRHAADPCKLAFDGRGGK